MRNFKVYILLLIMIALFYSIYNTSFEVIILGFILITCYLSLPLIVIYSFLIMIYVLLVRTQLFTKITKQQSILYRLVEPSLNFVSRLHPMIGKYTLAPFIIIITLVGLRYIYLYTCKFLVGLIMPSF